MVSEDTWMHNKEGNCVKRHLFKGAMSSCEILMWQACVMTDFFLGSWGCQLLRHVACIVYFVNFLFVYKLGKSLYENQIEREKHKG